MTVADRMLHRSCRARDFRYTFFDESARETYGQQCINARLCEANAGDIGEAGVF